MHTCMYVVNLGTKEKKKKREKGRGKKRTRTHTKRAVRRVSERNSPPFGGSPSNLRTKRIFELRELLELKELRRNLTRFDLIGAVLLKLIKVHVRTTTQSELQGFGGLGF